MFLNIKFYNLLPPTRYLCKMPAKKDFSLKPYNTFGIDATCRYFMEVSSIRELHEAIRFLKSVKLPLLVLGGGSNVLFTNDFNGVVLLNRMKGKELVEDSKEYVLLKASGGEEWPGLVDYCVSNNWGGVENLSLIPGTAGAAPIQNIGAYGMEVKDVITAVEVVDLSSGEYRLFSNADCAFGYRNSIFKSTERGKYFVTAVVLKLTKNPKVNLDYAPLKNAFEGRAESDITIQEVSDAVKKIRRSKLPDPEKTGNAGSFFKNPVVDGAKMKELLSRYHDVPAYPFGENQFKLAAGWLIEKSGWKGKRMGDAGVSSKQALVLVNHGNATGKEILNLANEIRKSVEHYFGVMLEFEVSIV